MLKFSIKLLFQHGHHKPTAVLNLFNKAYSGNVLMAARNRRCHTLPHHARDRYACLMHYCVGVCFCVSPMDALCRNKSLLQKNLKYTVLCLTIVSGRILFVLGAMRNQCTYTQLITAIHMHRKKKRVVIPRKCEFSGRMLTPPHHHHKNTTTPPQKHHQTIVSGRILFVLGAMRNQCTYTQLITAIHMHRKKKRVVIPRKCEFSGRMLTPPHHHHKNTTTPPQKHHHTTTSPQSCETPNSTSSRAGCLNMFVIMSVKGS